MISLILEKLYKAQNLTFIESKELFFSLMEGKFTEEKIISILESFIKKGETKDELAGAIYAAGPLRATACHGMCV